MTTLERIREGVFTQAEEEANSEFSDAIEELARVYGVDKDGLLDSIWETAQASIEYSLGNDEIEV